MTARISIWPEALVDPRGKSRRPATPLAARLPEFKGRKVLLFDNTQLYMLRERFGPLLHWISDHLERKHGAVCSLESHSLLKGSIEDHARLAEQLARSDAQAIVIALCNAGVTQATTLFAAELESRGIPCVLICTELGYPLAGVTAAEYVPGLPIVLVKPATGEGDECGRTQADAILPEVISGLTASRDMLLTAFRQRFPSSDFGIAKQGRIQLSSIIHSTEQVDGELRIFVDPGQFAEQLYEELCSADLCDGFPVIPPTEKRVEAMLEFSHLDPDFAVIPQCPPSGAAITILALAVNAVMAGCRAEYFPVLIAALEAVADPGYRLFQGAITSHPSGNAIIVSGPLAEELGIHSGAGCLGPGFRANATIGRALNLTIMNVARAIPGKSDLGVFGSPAEFTYCFAESDKYNPWLPLHSELYGPETTSVTVHKCEAPHNVLDPRAGPEELLRAIAATAATPGGNNLVYLGQLLVILNPGQAEKIAKAGWSKRDVKEFLFETARHPAELAHKQERAHFPSYFRNLQNVPVMRTPEDVILVVCGGRGGHAMVGVPWGRSRAVSRAVMAA